MSYYFFDRSGLVKRYVKEKGTLWVGEIVESNAGHTIFVSLITEVEVNSAFARLFSSGNLSQLEVQAAQYRARRHFRHEYRKIDVTTKVARYASDLVYQQTLRAYDAVQLASAALTNEKMGLQGLPTLIFVTADKRLVAAATTLGLQVEDPNTYP